MSLALVGVFLLLAGGLHLVFPQVSWFLSIGWKIAEAEPSDAYLAFSRIGGGIAVGIGIILLIVGLVHAGQQQSARTQGWKHFRQEMKASNIQSIRVQYGTQSATRHQIQTFAADIHRVPSATPYGDTPGARSGAFSAQAAVVVTCRDGYRASVIQVNNSGTFGIAPGSAWLAPSYEFTSQALLNWMSGIQ